MTDEEKADLAALLNRASDRCAELHDRVAEGQLCLLSEEEGLLDGIAFLMMAVAYLRPIRGEEMFHQLAQFLWRHHRNLPVQTIVHVSRVQ